MVSKNYGLKLFYVFTLPSVNILNYGIFVQEAERYIKDDCKMEVATDAGSCRQYRVSMGNLILQSTGDMLLLYFIVIAVVLLN